MKLMKVHHADKERAVWKSQLRKGLNEVAQNPETLLPRSARVKRLTKYSIWLNSSENLSAFCWHVLSFVLLFQHKSKILKTNNFLIVTQMNTFWPSLFSKEIRYFSLSTIISQVNLELRKTFSLRCPQTMMMDEAQTCYLAHIYHVFINVYTKWLRKFITPIHCEFTAKMLQYS